MEHEGIREIVEQQGWSHESLLTLVEEFLYSKDILEEFADFLEEKAEEENSET